MHRFLQPQIHSQGPGPRSAHWLLELLAASLTVLSLIPCTPLGRVSGGQTSLPCPPGHSQAGVWPRSAARPWRPRSWIGTWRAEQSDSWPGSGWRLWWAEGPEAPDPQGHRDLPASARRDRETRSPHSDAETPAGVQLLDFICQP